ncbi:hypothetical protein DFR52_10752 [Hoeflea marina]|uniref:Uncharacterized protein n=1 Tax=Hoeflea marina TaxID=274592 RepID=A0A317PCT6_9HYPH|nr:hypothetical protein [Hoeflea marina]PWV97141.1 hypothetical protein DFR52_10752 [Hoeflea marina]
MAAAKRRLFSAFHLSRKLAVLAGGFLVILGASGTAAVMFAAPGGLIPGLGEPAGGHCDTIYHAAFKRAGEVRLFSVIRTDDQDPAMRVRTGLRLARVLTESRHADLVTVLVTDVHGPQQRTDLRGPAVGVEVVHAPDLNRTRATTRSWEVRYIDTQPTSAGLYFGDRIDMSVTDIEKSMASIDKIEGCDGDLAKAEAEAATAAKAGGHGKPAAGHDKPAEHAAAPDAHAKPAAH